MTISSKAAALLPGWRPSVRTHTNGTGRSWKRGLGRSQQLSPNGRPIIEHLAIYEDARVEHEALRKPTVLTASDEMNARSQELVILEGGFAPSVAGPSLRTLVQRRSRTAVIPLRKLRVQSPGTSLRHSQP